MSTFSRAAAALTAALLAALSGATPAAADVVVDVGLPAPAANVDARGASEAVALPDGGVVLLGGDRGALVAAALRADGTPDRAFGTRGTARVAVPGGPLRVLQVLRQAGGRLVVVASTPPRVRYENPQLALVGLTADGRLDRAFGEAGVARPGIQAGCGGCAPAALTPDGAIVVTGTTGAVSPRIETDPDAPDTFAWAVARLTADGAPDAGFGAVGVAPVPGTAPGDGFGYGAAALADGRLVLLGTQAGTPLVTRVLADGAADPAFRGGLPAQLPLGAALRMAVAPDGAVVALGVDGRLVRLTPAGDLDAGFGTVALPDGADARILSTAGGGVLVARSPGLEARRASRAALLVDRVGPDGARVSQARVRLPFGGGLASFAGARERILPLPAWPQSSFTLGQVVARPDGSLVAAGGVRVVQYAGEGVGRSTARFAAAALTPGLRRDAAFGPPGKAARATLALPRQRARGARALRGVAVRLRASGPGLALVRVRDGEGRVLAEGVQPVFRAGSATMRVPIARAGARRLRSGAPIRVRVTASFRDVAGASATPRAVRGVLR